MDGLLDSRGLSVLVEILSCHRCFLLAPCRTNAADPLSKDPQRRLEAKVNSLLAGSLVSLRRCYSTVTLFARLRGWSISVPLRTAVW